MNSQARDSIHQTKEALQTAKQTMQQAYDQAENGHIRDQIEMQLKQISACCDECQKIASGLSQYLNEKNDSM